MAGRVPRGADREAVKGEMETVFVENLRHAAEVLAQENLVGLLEPINTRITDPQYFLDTPQQAAAILQKLDFTYLFQLLEDEGYQGFVGCEYRPRGDTVEGLSWLRSYWDRWGHPRTGQ
ncbi:rCG50422, isoform CRA_b [Rattus norvegicus]|nr:rCG50422, isoform CRA_b [Rattus norvegicus]